MDLFFDKLQSMPWWLVGLWVSVVAAIYGIKASEIKKLQQMTIKKSFAQQYSRKVKLLSQQTGTYGKGKVRFKQTKARKNTKKY